MKLVERARSTFVLVAILALTTISYGQNANQGGAYVYWDPIYPTPAYDTYEWTMTVVQLPTVQSYYYWAVQNGFVGGDLFYMGIQPYGACGITNAGNCKIALFSFFGDGATSTSPNCAPGADGGPGEQCRIAYDWVIGRQYKFLARLAANNGTIETWTGTVTDTTTGVPTTIGSWSIPASRGLIGTQGLSFTEYYQLYTGGCSAEPYAKVVWNVPIGYNNGRAYPGQVRSTAPTAACSGNAAFTISSGSVTVQTGGVFGPVILSVQDAASSRTSVVPGEWAAIYGKNLSNSTRIWNSGDFTIGNLLPTSLDDVSVQIGGIPAAVYFVSPEQIDVQVPNELSGTVPVTVTVIGAQSPPFTTAISQIAPSLFFYTSGSGRYAAATHADGSLIGDPTITPSTAPASLGETIALYVNGLHPSASGTIISTAVPDNSPVDVTIGGLNAFVSFRGLVAAGLFQVNVAVPTGIETGNFPLFSALIFTDLSLSNNGAGYCISGATTAGCGPMVARWIASPFSPNDNFTLTQIDLALGWISGTNGAVIDLVKSQSGLPGSAILQSWTLAKLPPSGPTAITTLTPTGPVPLNSGTEYWLVVKGSANDTLNYWAGNTSGLMGTLLSLDQGASWSNGTLNLSAFDVLGTPVAGGNAAVPVVVTAGGVSSQAGVILVVSKNQH